MRWWAALAVFALHSVVFLPVFPFFTSTEYWAIAEWVPMQVGGAGVPFFFVLSGFLMAWVWRSDDTPKAFYLRRVKKIGPTHLVAFAVLMLLIPVPIGRFDTWMPCLVLINSWWPNWTSMGAFNVPAWSLASEVLFYAVFPLLMPFITRIKVRHLWWWLAGVFAAILLLHGVYALTLPGYTGTENFFGPRLVEPIPATTAEYGYYASPEFFAQSDVGYPQTAYWFSYYFPLSRLPEFFVGVLAARMVRDGVWRSTTITWPLLALAFAFAATWAVPVNFKTSVVILLPVAAVVATTAVRDRRELFGWNASRVMTWLGEVSYAFYLLQYPVMVAVLRFALGGHAIGLGGWLAAIAGCFAISVIASGLVYTYIDKPITRGRRRRSATRDTATESVTA